MWGLVPTRRSPPAALKSKPTKGHNQVGLFRVLCMGLFAVVTRSQELQNCTGQLTVGSTEDAATLATSLSCSNGNFAVEWLGEVFVAQTIRVADGTSLNITGVGPDATADGRNIQQLFVVDAGSRLHLSDMALKHGNASTGTLYPNGGAIYSNQSSVSFSGNTSFSFNSANDGGAIYAASSNVSWNGDDIEFIFNSATEDGGALYAIGLTTVSWDGDGTRFSSNTASKHGGAIYLERSIASWDGDGIHFMSNSATKSGGAIYAFESKVFWNGDSAKFSYNSALVAGGAIYAYESDVFWYGDSSQFSSNSANDAGGAINAAYSSVSFGRNTTFHSNLAGKSGGALASGNMKPRFVDGLGFLDLVYYSGSTFINNSAVDGGAVYLQGSTSGYNFTDVIFESNSATRAGGAVAASGVGSSLSPLVFSRCHFTDNVASETGGAVETEAGLQEFTYCDFEGNSADVGGAMRLGGVTDVDECSFISNVASIRGLAVAVVGSANISRLSFDDNQLSCPAGSYQSDTKDKDDTTARFGAVCFDCPDWNECVDCTIARGSFMPTCASPLEHTSAEEPGVTLETLEIDGGYWRATNDSENVLECYNPDACVGGRTGAENYCAPEYTGPYCAVCEPGHSSSLGYTCSRCSSSRRQGFIAVAVIVALAATLAVMYSFKYLVSTELEEESFGRFSRWVLRGVNVQAFKIVVVVWQILTQFAEAAQVTYPSVYQDFLSAINVFANFDLGSVLAAGCFWSEIDFHDRLLINTLGPLIVVAGLAMTYRIGMLRNSTAGPTGLDTILHKHQKALLLLTFLVYSTTSATIFSTWACETLDDGNEYLRADYSILCTDSKHKAFEVYAGIMFLIYPAGIPLLYAILLFRRRDVLREPGTDKTHAQSIKGLWESYRPERFFYEVIECIRRIMLTGVVVFIFPNSAAQIAITILITFFFLMIFEMLLPYESKSDTRLARGGHVIVFLSMFYLLVLKVNVSSERDESRAVFAGMLVACHALMVLAIFVEVISVCGFMRRVSESKEPRSTRSIAVTGSP